jgi:hypothetical protein
MSGVLPKTLTLGLNRIALVMVLLQGNSGGEKLIRIQMEIIMIIRADNPVTRLMKITETQL